MHDSFKYHVEAVLYGTNFVQTYENPKKETRNLLDNGRLEQVKNNRDKIEPIINTVAFLRRQNHSLRGHIIHSELTESTATLTKATCANTYATV